MSVTVDQERLEAEEMGFFTVGQVLAHVQRDKRLVTSLLIDGEQPDLRQIGRVRESPLLGHTIYIETADPRQMAIDVIDEVRQGLTQAEQFSGQAVELLGRNQPVKATEKLGGCFAAWQVAQESIVKLSRLLRIDLEAVRVCGRPLARMLLDFAEQLRQIKTALENRDFVLLTDTLNYEMTQTSACWQDALDAIRDIVAGR